MDKEKMEKLMLNVDKEILLDLKKDLAEEMSKPSGERDENLISELEDMISKTNEEMINESKERSLESVMKMLDDYEEPKYAKLYKRISIAAACLIIALGLNTASLKAFGQNMFSTIYNIIQGGVQIDNPFEKFDITVSGSDPYGMKAKCAEYGFFPATPTYIPEGFVLNNVDAESNDEWDCVSFFYKKDNKILNFFFENYKINPENFSISIPTNTYNVTEEQINGHKTYILKEDKQFTSIYIENGIKYMIFAEDLSYDECQKILESLS